MLHYTCVLVQQLIYRVVIGWKLICKLIPVMGFAPSCGKYLSFPSDEPTYSVLFHTMHSLYFTPYLSPLCIFSDETPQKKDLRRARKIFKNKPKEVYYYYTVCIRLRIVTHTLWPTTHVCSGISTLQWLCVQTHSFGGCSSVVG